MFTGIVEELGSVESIQDFRYRFVGPVVAQDAKIGDSIAVNGCCLTVVALAGDSWEADVSPETLRCTCLGALKVGDRINLERPLRLADRLGGHLVAGHVDGVGVVVARPPELAVRIPAELTRYCVSKGSITIDGVSLTIVAVQEDVVSFAIIPHTAAVTTLGIKEVGETVDVEADLLAKHVEQLMRSNVPSERPPSQ